jgi:tRNA nucleotidyltransferase/poly(A) polymerase
MIEVDNGRLKLVIEPTALLLLAKICNFLTEQGIKSYLVGGFVRDGLLGRVTADIDIMVAAEALEMAPRVAAAIGGTYVLLDEANRVGRVVLADEGTAIARGRWHIHFATLKAASSRTWPSVISP